MPKLVSVDGEAQEVEEIKPRAAKPPIVIDKEPEPEIVDVGAEEASEDEEPVEIDDNEEYWKGGPTGAQVKEWKNVYGDIYVTSVTPDKHIVWRTLTRFEYRRLVKSLDQQSSSGQVTQAEANLNNEESIAETVILFPEYKRDQVSGYMAGIASLISQEAMEASGFVALEIRQL